MNDVTYWCIYENGKQVENDYKACFSAIMHSGQYGYRRDSCPKAVRYQAKVSENLTNNEVIFYFEFLHKILDVKKYPWKYESMLDKKDRCVMVTCDYNDTWAKLLLHLVAFRLVEEFPTVVKKLYKHRKIESISKLFDEFCNIHYHMFTDERENVNSNHALMYDYKWNSQDIDREDANICNLKTFKENLGKTNISTVFEFFKNQ